LVRPTMSLYDFGERQLGLDPNLPVENTKALAAQMNEDIFEDRLFSTLAAAFVAAHLPARRASKVDPIHTPKHE
jgi:ABC-type lipoprotein release transport system permease subunit